MHRLVHWLDSDRDDGFGDLDQANTGKGYSVAALLKLMIDFSSNTATSMLIRLVGREAINNEMKLDHNIALVT